MARKDALSDPRGRGKKNKKKEEELTGEVYEEELYEEPVGISLRTMKRAGRFLIISIVFLVIALLCVAGYMFYYNSTVLNKQHSCWLQQQNVEYLATRYVSENGFSSMPAYIEDIPGFQNVYVDCPTGGAYTWNPITEEYSCSEHGHWPSGFNHAQSINKGTTMIDKPKEE